MGGEIRLTIRSSGAVTIGPETIIIERGRPVREIGLPLWELQNALNNAFNKNGVKGVSVEAIAVNRYGAAARRGDNLMVVIRTPDKVNLYRLTLRFSKGFDTLDMATMEIKRPVARVLQKYNLSNIMATRYKMTIPTGAVSEPQEAEV